MGCNMVGTKGPGLDGLDDQLGGVYAKIFSYQNDWGVKDKANSLFRGCFLGVKCCPGEHQVPQWCPANMTIS